MKVLNNFDQGSIDWLEARCGRITMSNAKQLLTKGKGKTRQSYILDVVAERLSSEPIEGYHGLDMERGNFLEEWAVKAFEHETGRKCSRVGFVLHDDERIGCSPDALIGDDEGLEIKTPNPRQHIKNIFADGFADYMQQVQGCLGVTERRRWYLVSFCPWVTQSPLHVRCIERDEAMIEAIAESATDAANTVDELVARALSIQTNKAASDVAVQARTAWENATADNDQVIL